MLIDAPPTLSNTIMHHKHLSHRMAKSMNELAHKSPLIFSFGYLLLRSCFVSNYRDIEMSIMEGVIGPK